MSWKPPCILFIFLFLSSLIVHADEEKIYVESVVIDGNKVTRESYIRSFLTIEEHRVYELDSLIDEINLSRQNLEKTDLFSSIFFNDQLDDSGNLTLTIVLKEKNYVHFGLTGYLGHEDGDFYSVSSIYADYSNLFGNTSILYSEIPFYKDYGVLIRFRGNLSPFIFILGYEYRDDEFFNQKIYRATIGSGYEVREKLLLNLDIDVGHEKENEDTIQTTSLVFLPSVEYGTNFRFTTKIKRWYYLQAKPYLGYNLDSSSAEADKKVFYGIESGLNLYWDLLLRIVYSLKITGHYQDGEVPNNFLVISNIRGTYFDAKTGNYLISLGNEFTIPWPTNDKINFVPFLDTGIIDDEFLIGGGLGFHLYTKYQDPFIVELAFGKGVMLNLSRRF